MDTPRVELVWQAVVTVSAPDGPWAWLNRRVLVGALHPLQPKAPTVLVRVFSVG